MREFLPQASYCLTVLSIHLFKLESSSFSGFFPHKGNRPQALSVPVSSKCLPLSSFPFHFGFNNIQINSLTNTFIWGREIWMWASIRNRNFYKAVSLGIVSSLWALSFNKTLMRGDHNTFLLCKCSCLTRFWNTEPVSKFWVLVSNLIWG